MTFNIYHKQRRQVILRYVAGCFSDDITPLDTTQCTPHAHHETWLSRQRYRSIRSYREPLASIVSTVSSSQDACGTLDRLLVEQFDTCDHHRHQLRHHRATLTPLPPSPPKHTTHTYHETWLPRQRYLSMRSYSGPLASTVRTGSSSLMLDRLLVKQSVTCHHHQHSHPPPPLPWPPTQTHNPHLP